MNLSHGLVHVWNIDSTVAKTRGGSTAYLAADERAKASRFFHEADRERFVASRTVLRTILAAVTNSRPERIEFTYTQAGKPELRDSSHDLHFNVSHSGDRILIALARGTRIGADVEMIRKDQEQILVATAAFSAAERCRLRMLPASEQTASFYRCWTRKEALLKALGCGLPGGLERFTVSVEANSAALLHAEPELTQIERWRLFALEDPRSQPAYAAAVAVESPAAQLVLHHAESAYDFSQVLLDAVSP